MLTVGERVAMIDQVKGGAKRKDVAAEHGVSVSRIAELMRDEKDLRKRLKAEGPDAVGRRGTLSNTTGRQAKSQRTETEGQAVPPTPSTETPFNFGAVRPKLADDRDGFVVAAQAKGARVKAIAEQVGVSTTTVRRVLNKTGVKGAADAKGQVS